MAKPKNQKWYKEKAIELAKKITREKEVCEKCGKTQGQFHGSHILGLGAYSSMGAELENLLCLCAGCHRWSPHSWHAEPLENATWFDDKWPGRKQKLYEMARLQPKVDWQQKYNELRLY